MGKIQHLILGILIASTSMTLAQIEEPESNATLAEVTGLPSSFFISNRQELRDKLPDRSVALIFSAPEKVRSNDVLFPFHQSPNFYYLTGFNEPNALLIIFREPFIIKEDTVKELMFVPGRSLEYERWNGIRLGTAGVKNELGFKMALINEEFPDFFIDFSFFDKIFYDKPDGVVPDDPQDRGDSYSLLKHFHFKTDSLQSRKNEHFLSSQLALMREIKDSLELEIMQKAIDITCEAQRNLMSKIDPSFTEYMAEAEIEYTFRKMGAEAPGFPSIVGGGKNSCILHYVTNQHDLSDGDLLVVDVGAEYRNYTADVTRTIPVNGKFSEEQAQIYNLVLEAQMAGIKKCVAGNKFWDPHEAATEVIQKGLKNLGIIKKEYESRKYFMHGTSHYLGLDVHDAGSNQPLRPGNVITVEPGIYIPKGADCDEKWWDIGVRIEDDILITTGDPVNMSNCVPSMLEEVEKLMK